MRTINKHSSPQAFEDWKINLATIAEYIANDKKTGDDVYALLPSNLSGQQLPNEYSKNCLRNALVSEQFFICCYCNDEIKGEPLDTRVEHFLPKESNKCQTFEYTNLFAACYGNQNAKQEDKKEKPSHLHCDNFKGYKNPIGQLVSPLDKNAHTHFKYLQSGAIEGITDLGKSSIEFLNLNCERLKKRRKVVLAQYLYDETKDIAELIEEATNLDANGKIQPFCMAVLQLLNDYS
jgi:uncharacterized protein (TIGR02646 family)